MTAALHALILFVFYLLISGLGDRELVVFQQQNIFIIKNKQQEPYTSSKQQERHNKELKEVFENFLQVGLAFHKIICYVQKSVSFIRKVTPSPPQITVLLPS